MSNFATRTSISKENESMGVLSVIILILYHREPLLIFLQSKMNRVKVSAVFSVEEAKRLSVARRAVS